MVVGVSLSDRCTVQLPTLDWSRFPNCEDSRAKPNTVSMGLVRSTRAPTKKVASPLSIVTSFTSHHVQHCTYARRFDPPNC